MLPRNSIVHWRSFRRFALAHALELTGRAHSADGQRATTTCTRPSPTRCSTATRCALSTSHRHEQQQDDCRPTKPRDRSAHTRRRTGGRRRAATAAHRRHLGASAVVVLAAGRTRAAHGRSGAGRMTNERRSTASPWQQQQQSGVVRRASGTHMHSVSQQRSSAIACATCSRHVVSLTSDQRVGGASQRTRALGLSAEIGSAVAGAWWARVSAAEHDDEDDSRPTTTRCKPTEQSSPSWRVGAELKGVSVEGVLFVR
jgi:hypothetical protein